jgi:hypothetical protein
MKTIISNSLNTKGKVILITMLLLLLNLNASANENFGSDEPANFAFNPIFSYLILAGVFITGILIFTFFKHKEEKQKRERKNARQEHFAARYSKHRLS